MVGKLLSFWEGNFSGAMLNFRWVLWLDARLPKAKLGMVQDDFCVELRKSTLEFPIKDRRSENQPLCFLFMTEHRSETWFVHPPVSSLK